MSKIAKLVDRFTEADIEDEIVIMRVDTGEFYALTGTGVELWRLIDGNRGKPELIAELASRFDGEQTDIAADVSAFVAQLQDRGFVVSG